MNEKLNTEIALPRKKSYILVLFFLVVSAMSIIGFAIVKRNPDLDNAQSKEITTSIDADNSVRLVCDRTSRLENDPNIDRALSLIYERLTEYGDENSLFPSQLINCIKVEIKNIKNETGAEGYFDESNDDIKSNYFPIVIDDLGNYFADDLSTALLLVHEITHVQQYIDRYNLNVDPTNSDTLKSLAKMMTKSRCLDNEVSAYGNQLDFLLILKNEEKKSIDYRILVDNNPIPQIQILKSLKESFEDFSYANSCEEKYDLTCIKRGIHIKIYDLLRDSGAYDEQCGSYEGKFIGE